MISSLTLIRAGKPAASIRLRRYSVTLSGKVCAPSVTGKNRVIRQESFMEIIKNLDTLGVL